MIGYSVSFTYGAGDFDAELLRHEIANGPDPRHIGIAQYVRFTSYEVLRQDGDIIKPDGRLAPLSPGAKQGPAYERALAALKQGLEL